MLYHKLHWGAAGRAEFLLGAAPMAPPWNRPCYNLHVKSLLTHSLGPSTDRHANAVTHSAARQ